jgi:hypothetical protein
MKMRPLIIILLYLSINAYSQECEPEFFDLGLDNISNPNLFKTGDGNYILIADHSSGPNTDIDIMIRKMTITGTEIWTKYVGDTLQNKVRCVKQISGDALILVSTDSKAGSNSTISIIYKIDAQGDIVWNINKKDTAITDVAEDKTGNIIFCGYFSWYDLYLLKVDVDGKMLVRRTEKFQFFNNHFESIYKGLKPFCMTLDDNDNVHLGVFFTRGIYSSFGELGDLYWIKYNTDLSQSMYSKLSERESDIDEPFRIIIKENGTIDYWCKPGIPGYDASANLFLVYELDSTGKMNKKNYHHHCGFNITDLLFESDSSYLVLADHCLYRFDNEFKLLSRSTFNNGYTSSLAGDHNRLVKDDINQYTIINYFNNKLMLVRYSYFGTDCLTQICGRIYTDVNRNCILDSLDQVFNDPVYYIPGDCRVVHSDTLGNYMIQGEYGLNYLIVSFDNAIYESSCKNLVPDTARVKYPVKKVNHDMAVFKKNACFLFSTYFQSSYITVAKGGINRTNFSLTNKVDSTMYNFQLKFVKNPQLYFMNANKSYMTVNDTLVFIIDTLKKGFTYQLTLHDSIPCNALPGDKFCYDLYIQGKDRCVDTSYFKKHTVCTSPSNNSGGFISGYVLYSVGRPCERSQLNRKITNKGSTNLYNVKVEVERDPRLIKLFTSHSYIDQSGIWQFTIDSIKPEEDVNLVIIDSISCNAKIGDRYCYVIKMEHYDKCDNQFKSSKDSFCVELSNSHDPNFVDARINNVFDCYFKGQSEVDIDYTIHFQNTGNDTAFRVKVYDTLSPSVFDMSSLVMGTSSHSYVSKIINDSILEFDFKDIDLLASQIDDEKSQGFVSFRIPASIQVNKYGNYLSILNRAAIYFDRNEAVLTDWNYLGPCGFTVSVNNEFKSVQSKEIYLYPNPANSRIYFGNVENISGNSQLSIYNIYGKNISKYKWNQVAEGLDIEKLESGSYLLVINNKQEIFTMRLVIVR